MSEGARTYLQLQAAPSAEAILDTLRGQVSLPAVLLELLPEDEQDLAALTRVVHMVQDLDAAALIRDSIEIAKACKADGVHLSAGPELMVQYERARNELPSDCIVGASTGLSRHSAMVVGEAGADYVAFEASCEAGTQGHPQDEQVELLTWWSELFEIPCVALGAINPEEGGRLADAGADFVGYAPAGTEQASDIAEQIQTFERKLLGKSEQAATNV